MRAITGAVVSSMPCPLGKAAAILSRFSDSAASHLPSSDCATYLRTAADATTQHDRFRRKLRGNHQQGAANLDAHGYEGLAEGERRHRYRERNGGMLATPGGSRHDSAAEAEVEVAAGEKKSKKKKKDDLQEDRAVAGVDSHIPASPEIANEKRRRKKEKEKHSNKEIAGDVKQELGLVVEQGLGSEKQKTKKKKEKDHVKLEGDAKDVNEVDGHIVNDIAAEQRVAGGEKKRKKKKHEEEVGDTKDVKEEEKIVDDGDLDSDKKRKKKRGRGDSDDNALEQVEHTKKKQRKQSRD